jgi:hypothetical protein
MLNIPIADHHFVPDAVARSMTATPSITGYIECAPRDPPAPRPVTLDPATRATEGHRRRGHQGAGVTSDGHTGAVTGSLGRLVGWMCAAPYVGERWA